MGKPTTSLVLLCGLLAACADNDRPPPPPTAIPSATPTVTPQPTATATPAPSATPSETATAPPSPTATATPVAGPTAVARRIDDASDLIGGPLAVGRLGDYLLANDRIRVVIRAPGRDLSFMLTYGGNIVDADIVRPEGEPGHDQFGAMTPLLNISSTVNVTEIQIVNDGSDGRPAVLRAVGVDDLLDAIDPTNAIRGFGAGAVPVQAQDRDLPVEVVTEYTLAPGDDFVRIETRILNTSDAPLPIYVGDFFNASGHLDPFGPSIGFGDATLRFDMPFVAFLGVGAAEGITYGLIPEPLPGTQLTASAFGQSGVMVYVMGQSVLDILLGQQPPVLEIPPGDTGSFARRFVVTAGDVGAVAARAYELHGRDTGTVRGTVTAGGEPAAGAIVAAVQRPGEAGAEFNVVSAFRTGPDGTWSGSLPPGDYVLMARLEGYPYEDGGDRPVEHPVTVEPGAEVVQDFALPGTARLRVDVSDPSGAPLPAKVSIVGPQRSPDPGNEQSLGGLLVIRGAVFGSDIDQKGAELFGLTGVRFAGPDGTTGEFPLPPGDYEVVVSRGPEYSVHRQRVTLVPGETAHVDAVLTRVVDTTGFISADYHVHLINSPDSWIPRADRILTMAAEGVDYFVATDHDFLTDLRPEIERLGLQSLVATSVSEEITTFNMGHFNAWPLERLPDRWTGGSVDWGRAGVEPGRDYPSLGSYDLSPAELFAAVRERLAVPPEDGVLQVNHFNSDILGHFHLLGIDTGVVPPVSRTDPGRIRLDPSLGNLYDDGYTTLEVWIEGSRQQTDLFRQANLGDWFNLLNQGRIKSATADSDTHTTAIVQAGGPRNFVASPSDEASTLDETVLARSVRDGRVVGSNAPFVRVAVEGDDGSIASLDLDRPTLVSATTGSALLRVDIQSPEWAEFDTVEVYVNTVPRAEPDSNFHGVTTPRYAVEPTFVLFAGEDFAVERVTVDDSVPGAARWEAHVELPLVLSRDAWIVVIVRGTDGVSRPLWPMNPQDLQREGNETLDDLTDGNLGEGGNLALAFTNPLFVDVDGNGRFDPSMEMPPPAAP